MVYGKNDVDISPAMCFRCLHYGERKVKKGKDKWYRHYFSVCSNCGSKVFFGDKIECKTLIKKS